MQDVLPRNGAYGWLLVLRVVKPSVHTVEKIGGTSISNPAAILENVLIGGRKGSALYNRIFVLSTYNGMTDRLLEHKKTGKPGVYALFARARSRSAWVEAVPEAHREENQCGDLRQLAEKARGR